jgi:hypothetical protein
MFKKNISLNLYCLSILYNHHQNPRIVKMEKEILAIIPARVGVKRFPVKILGKYMVNH